MKYSRLYLIKELLFQCVDPEYISRLTGWRKGLFDPDNPVSDSLLKKKLEEIGDDTGHPDYDDLKMIEAAFYVLNSQHHQTLVLKYENLPPHFPNVYENEFPNILCENRCINWARHSIWTDEQAICLSLGLNPSDTVIEYIQCPGTFSFMSFTLNTQFIDRQTKMGMAFRAETLNNEPSPIEYVRWFKRMRYSFPERLQELVLAIQGDGSLDNIGCLSSSSDNELAPRKRTSLLKLIHAMGRAKGIGYDSDNTRNGAISRIQSLILDADLELSERTIRETMKEAAEEAARLKDKNN